MSHENVEIVKTIFTAWETRNPEAALSRIDPNVEVDVSNSSVWGDATIGRGYEALQRWILSLLEAWEPIEFFPERFIDADPHVIVSLRITARGRTSGAPTERRAATVYTVRGGLVLRFRAFETLAEAKKAVGI